MTIGERIEALEKENAALKIEIQRLKGEVKSKRPQCVQEVIKAISKTRKGAKKQ